MSVQRVELTYVLLDLLEQQSKRKKELFDTLLCLEMQRENETQDFWLLQYQKLLDSQPGDLSFRSTSIDPMLGYNFLVNGVVHCIPFLSKLWQSENFSICDITDDDLLEAGIKKAADREKILQSIRDFIKLDQPQAKEAIPDEPTAPEPQSTSSVEETTTELDSECVICMEEPVSCFIMHSFLRHISWHFTILHETESKIYLNSNLFLFCYLFVVFEIISTVQSDIPAMRSSVLLC